MKYVRTEDGIYEDAGTEAHGLRCVRCNGEKIALSQDYDKIVKEANIIEKLFDMCFVKRQYDHMYKLGTLYECACEIEVFKKKLKSINPITAIYGLIMTFDETGAPTIKPVAKLNGEGEWELMCTLKWLENQRLRH